eukprot:6491737-Amphidinium_carterae.2
MTALFPWIEEFSEGDKFEFEALDPQHASSHATTANDDFAFQPLPFTECFTFEPAGVDPTQAAETQLQEHSFSEIIAVMEEGNV